MTFVVGFLGIIIYLMYAYIDKNKSKNTLKSIESKIYNDEIIMNTWLNKMTDYNVECDINSIIRDYKSTKYVYDIAYPIVSSFKHFNVSFSDPSEFKIYMFNNHYMMLERILLAIRGKLSKSDAMFGISSPMVYDKLEVHRWMVNDDMIRWMTGLFASNGLIDKTFFKKNSDKKFDINNCDVICCDLSCNNDNYTNNPLAGIYFWEPIAYRIFNYA